MRTDQIKYIHVLFISTHFKNLYYTRRGHTYTKYTRIGAEFATSQHYFLCISMWYSQLVVEQIVCQFIG